MKMTTQIGFITEMKINSLINIEDEYNAGIVLGPYDTLGKKKIN